MKQYAWFVVVMILVLVPLLAACGGGAAPTPEPPAPPPAEVEEPPPAATPTAIPHLLEGHDDCLLCHETGVAGAPQFPADHAGRTSDTCTACHQPAG